MWVGWSARELSEFKKVAAEYDAKNPNVQVKVVGGINDDKIIAALRSGSGPDVVSSFTSSNVGLYCSSGGWIDLAPYLKKSNISMNEFPATTRYYTQYKGTRCALPLLADAYGFYYNKKLFREAGLTGPPKTMEQLTEYAKKLTVKNADGSLKVVGYDPEFGFYQNTSGAYQPLFGATWFDKQGKSSLSTDPAWKRLLTWQKNLVDFYGHSNLVKWQAGAGDEFSASHAFETGKLAMMMDGEWRVSFIASEHPDLEYGTAPMPVDGARANLYGGGYINGTIIGIPKNGRQPRRGLGLRQVHDHGRSRAREVLERDQERPLDAILLEVAGAEARHELRRVLEDLRQPEFDDDPDHVGRGGVPGDVPELPGQVAVGQGEARLTSPGSTSRSTPS